MQVKRYLILEDEPLIAMDLMFAFEDAGVDAVTAVSCREAVAEIERDQLCGAVLDVNLGHGETCEEAARRLTEQRIPFVLHTGDLNRVGEFLRSLGAPILAKPRAADEVIRFVMDMVDGETDRDAAPSS
ncbi:response regulator [Tsuneonella amylolytica]|uniref:response regulator n=1 Tax=Tsuneonella amylolytica TaxID=2338327 RepID=UPI000EA90732|nr:response regulator [Tsuneonella amylolytica]